MTLDQAIETFLSARRNLVSPKTLRINRQYLRALRSYLGERDLAAITIEDLRAWRESLYARDMKFGTDYRRGPLPGKLSIYTIKGMLLNTRQFFTWLVEEKHLPESPARRLEVPLMPRNPPKDVSDETLALLLEAALRETSPTRRLRNVALLLFIRDSGCRLGGAASLRYVNLNLEQRYALVVEKGKGGGITRKVYFTEEAQEALMQWMLIHPAVMIRRAARKADTAVNVDHVFVSERYPYGPLTPPSIYSVFKELRRKAGVTARANPHGLRHRRARSMLQKGAPLGLVSRVLGHSSIATTDQYYAVYADSEVQQGFDRYA